MYDTIIIGAGPAGLAAAIYCGRKKLKTAIVTIDVGGQGNLTSHIENYPGALPQSGMELMNIFKTQVDKFEAEFIYGKVMEVKKVKNTFEVVLGNNEKYSAKTIILTYGKVPRRLGIPGEDEFFGRGVSTCATCDGPLYKDKEVAIVGGGNSAVEAALDISAYAKKVYLIHRRKEFRADEVTVEKLKQNKKVELVLDSVPAEVKGDKFVSSVVIENTVTKEKKELSITGLFLEIGYVVDSSMVKDLVKINKWNEVIINSVGETSCPGIFAAGDVTNTPFKQAIIASGDGARVALQTYGYLTGGKAVSDW
ncbi:thioredoxin-disulfide reductase [Candidatus Woesearchaeota archaeon]|jgi:NADH-dependent peroxiredoxin subunit F|nr:thioredoxin-disulfide reductase [Candidatus Woesearchaeota archaeon]MBT5343232.1 thioredoxin-disulfide reductase [Candidatus Woesearchaeota archaeon]